MSKISGSMTLEEQLSALIEELRPGGTQAHCEALRAKIAAVHRAIAGSIPAASTTDDYADD